jgi:hypothetical protein
MTEPLAIRSKVETNPICLKFEQGDDRWGHQFELNTPAGEIGLLTSVEGTPEQAWPPSAPLQDASQELLGDINAILCVGMAGSSHWSAAFSVEPDQSLRSDIACLQKKIAPGASMGSTYQLDPTWSVDTNADDRIELSYDGVSIVIETLLGDDLKTQLELNDRLLTVRPVEITERPNVATRWGFQLRIATS